MAPPTMSTRATNEPEDNTPTRGAFEKLKPWKRGKDANEPAPKPRQSPHALDDLCMDRSGRLLVCSSVGSKLARNITAGFSRCQ